jgi:hypothetical protein
MPKQNGWISDLIIGTVLVLVFATTATCTYYEDTDVREHRERMLELKIEAKKVGIES